MKSSNGKQLKATFDWLKNNGYRVCILSDNSIGAKRKYKMLWRKYGLKYDNFIVSQEVGWEKPDRRMIEAIPKALGIANSEAVHFGNNIYRDAACRKWGMPFVLVTGYLIKYGEMHFNGPKIKYISPNSITAVLSRVIR
jgi:HAD superfamily hydrolase (TIGR01549 family)